MGHETLTTKCTACSLAVVRSLRGLWSGAGGLPEIDELDHLQHEPGQAHLPPWRTEHAQTAPAQVSTDLRARNVAPPVHAALTGALVAIATGSEVGRASFRETVCQ